MKVRPNQRADDYTRYSFSWRRMQPWQVWSITIAAIVITLAMLVYQY